MCLTQLHCLIQHVLLSHPQLEKLAMELTRLEEQTLALVARLGALRKEVELSPSEVKEMGTMQVQAPALRCT